MKKTPENRSVNPETGEEPLEEAEMVEILEQIARNGSDTARIQAIKALRTIFQPEEAPEQDEWADIYGDNVTPIASRRRSA